MKNQIVKKISFGTAAGLVIGLGGLAVGAMFFDADADDFFSLIGAEEHGRQVTQPMELQGSWLGMRMLIFHSRTAVKLGVPPGTEGVVVTELNERTGMRARQAGVVTGDVVQAIDGEPVRDMADLFDITQKVNVADAVLLDVLRWGQTVTLVLPGVAFSAPQQQGQIGILRPPVAPLPPTGVAPMPQAGMMPQQPAAMNPALGQPLGQPAAFMPAATGRGAGAGNGQFFCPNGGHYMNQTAVRPGFQCPYCNGQVVRVQ